MNNRARPRLAFVDALRGWAFVLMALNHTSYAFLAGPIATGKLEMVFVTVALAAPLFLFLVGFSLAISGARLGSMPRRFRHYAVRGLLLIALGFAVNFAIRQDLTGISGGILQTIGLCVICLAPFLPVLSRRGVRPGLLALAVALYLAFVLFFPDVRRDGCRVPGALCRRRIHRRRYRSF